MRPRFLGRPLVFFAADAGGDGGGGDAGGKTRPSDIQARFNGDAQRMAERIAELLDDNHSYREKNRQLKADLEAAQKLAPAEGSLVLSKEQAAAWEAYQKLGKPEELERAVTDGKATGAELAELRRKDALRAAAAAEGLNADALLALPNLPPITLEDVKDGEATVKRAFVTPEGGSKTALRDYGKQQHAALWPAVEATGGQGEQRQQGTVRVPIQSTGGGTPRTAKETVQGAVSKLGRVPGQQKQQ